MQKLISQNYAHDESLKLILQLIKPGIFFSELFILEESLSSVNGLFQEWKVKIGSAVGIKE